MFDNEPNDTIQDSKETIMLKAIILIAAIVVIGFVIAPRITAHELVEHHDVQESWSLGDDNDRPRYTVVTVRGVRPTFDDGGEHGQIIRNRARR